MIEWTEPPENNEFNDLSVGRIFCLGGNYGAHQKEMGISYEQPPIFIKVDGSLITGDEPIVYPPDTSNFHYEGEFILLIGDIPARSKPSWNNVIGITAGLDMTKRDLQADARKQGKPWETSKSFPGAARLAPFVPTNSIDNPEKLKLILKVNGEKKQSATFDEMILSADQILQYIHTWMPLRKGDIIFTGTPKGVGPVTAGDVIELQIKNLVERIWEVVGGKER